MSFRSILFARSDDGAEKLAVETPECFADLNLDQVVDAIVAGREQYNLKPFFYTPLSDLDSITYRHEVMRELENKSLFACVESFAAKMRAMRQHLAQAEKLYYKLQKQSWFLDAVEIYCDAVVALLGDLSRVELKSRGFLDVREYLAAHTGSDRFVALQAETKKLQADLATIRYSMLIKNDRVTVRKYQGEADVSVEVDATFAKFKQGAVRDYHAKFANPPEMNHIEANVLEGVRQLYPEIFSDLDGYCARNGPYLDHVIEVFDREIQFYIAYLEQVGKFKRAGLKFCYPKVSDQDKGVVNHEGFDLALAYKLLNGHATVVCNDFYLAGKERIIVVTGPNQGGKTTFARTFGQLHFLASLGCPVPGRQARLFLFDRIFTHFEKEENIKDLRGKLEDDLHRIRNILDRIGPNSIVIINEIFNSTTSRDALFLSKKIVARLLELDLLCVCVTFLDELASMSEKIVSMASTVVPENPSLRTFKILRKPADGLAFAISIAEKYRLTYRWLKERIKP